MIGGEMPLLRGIKARTKKGISENIRREISSGKPRKVAIAIAHSMARKRKKKVKKKR
jgi:hypothetical protein